MWMMMTKRWVTAARATATAMLRCVFPGSVEVNRMLRAKSRRSQTKPHGRRKRYRATLKVLCRPGDARCHRLSVAELTAPALRVLKLEVEKSEAAGPLRQLVCADELTFAQAHHRV